MIDKYFLYIHCSVTRGDYLNTFEFMDAIAANLNKALGK